MTAEEHKKQHIELHKAFDELFADYIKNHPSCYDFLNMPIRDLMQWSYIQTMYPTEIKTLDEANRELENFEKLIDKFFRENSKEQIRIILKKYDEMKFEGIPIGEYLNRQRQLNDFDTIATNTVGEGNPPTLEIKKTLDETNKEIIKNMGKK